jgi:hypothetical protein
MRRSRQGTERSELDVKLDVKQSSMDFSEVTNQQLRSVFELTADSEIFMPPKTDHIQRGSVHLGCGRAWSVATAGVKGAEKQSWDLVQ